MQPLNATAHTLFSSAKTDRRILIYCLVLITWGTAGRLSPFLLSFSDIFAFASHIPKPASDITAFISAVTAFSPAILSPNPQTVATNPALVVFNPLVFVFSSAQTVLSSEQIGRIGCQSYIN